MLASLLFAATLAAATTTTLPAPADGLGLAAERRPVPPIRPVPLPGWESPLVPPPDGGSLPVGPIEALIAAVAAGLAVAAGKARRGSVAPEAPANVDVLFVPGYGSAASGTFDELVAAVGLSPDQVHRFDYRTVVPVPDHAQATREARVGALAEGIDARVAGLEADGRWVYLVGFSKGGAAVAELVARWDADPDGRRARVVGAALLDPPIGAWAEGAAQSIGVGHDWIPDDGGYDPIRPRGIGLHDTRVALGQAAGVATMVIRNPDSWPISMSGAPLGLRVYDVDDGEGSGIARLPNGPGAALERIGQAHTSVLRSPATAECILAELWQAGGCEPAEPAPPARPQPASSGRAVSGPSLNLVL